MPPGPPSKPGFEYISRLEMGATRGWQVRMQRDGDKHRRIFQDKKHGGTDAALEAARAWRDELLEELGPAPRQDARQMLTPEARQRNREAVSATGVTGIGVTLREFPNERVPYVTAYYLDDRGKRRQTSYSVKANGLEGAVRLAARARARTSDWHGADPMTEDEIAEAAFEGVRRRIRSATRSRRWD